MTPTRELVALDHAHLWHPYQPNDAWLANPDPPVVVGAQGVWLDLADGRRLIDGIGSWWTSVLGHGHPRVRAAMHAQIDRMGHVPIAGVTHEPAVRLAARLCALAPLPLSRVFFSDNGSTSVEVAIRAAFQFFAQNGAPQRTRFVSFEGAYHGDTIGAVSVGGVRVFHELFAPLCFEVLHVPSGAGGAAWSEASLAALDRVLEVHGSTVAAVVVEPLVQGAGGMRMTSPEWVRGVRERCDRHGALLVCDEVFVGFGRTGTLFACEQCDVAPDFLCLSKGLSGGELPFAATLTSERIFAGFGGDPSRTFFYGHSMAGNPLGCAAALAVLDAFEHDDVLGRARARAGEIAAWVPRLAALPGVAEVRQISTIAAVELDATPSYLDPIGARVARAALERGAWLRPLGNVVYVVPALTIEPFELDRLMRILHDAIAATTGHPELR